MTALLNLALAVSAISAIVVDALGQRRAFFVLKPLSTAFVLALAASRGETGLSLALLLCLLGDVGIMLNTERGFMAGLVAFLLAHLILIALMAPDALAWHYGVPALVAALCLAAAVLRPAWRQGTLLPAWVYTAVLLSMAVAALRFAPLAGFGAALFLLSDAVLAYKTFHRNSRGAQVLVLASYWLAIALIVNAF